MIYDTQESLPYVNAVNVQKDGTEAPTQLSFPVGDFVNCVTDGLGKL